MPGSIDAKKGVAKRLLEVYDNQPASFKKAKLNLEDTPAVKKTHKRPLLKTRAKKPQRPKKKQKKQTYWTPYFNIEMKKVEFMFQINQNSDAKEHVIIISIFYYFIKLNIKFF